MTNDSPQTKSHRDPVSILGDVKRLAREYYSVTGKPLGATGEIAEYEAAKIFGLSLTEARTIGHDASKNGCTFQIKGRRITGALGAGRTGKFPRGPWDYALLVLLDEHFDAEEIYLAARATVVAALDKPGSKARNERRDLSISKFKALAGGTPAWSRHLPDQLRRLALPECLK